MKLLLDTHVLIWWSIGARKLGSRARDMIIAPDSDLFVSAASWWKLSIKQALGKIDIDLRSTRRAVERRGVAALAVTMEHGEAAAALAKVHGDPFDHMLVAQAVAENLVLLTRDQKLGAYGSSVLLV